MRPTCPASALATATMLLVACSPADDPPSTGQDPTGASSLAQLSSSPSSSPSTLSSVGPTTPRVPSGPPSGPPAADSSGPLPGTESVGHATMVGAAGTESGQVVLVVGEYGTDGYRSGYQAYARAADGTWSPPVELADRRLSSFSVRVASAADGSGVVSWDDYPDHGPPVLWARVRHADGTWEAPRVIIRGGGAANGVDQVAAASGDHTAVLYDDHGGQPVVAVDDHGAWSEFHTPLGEPWGPQVALDADGGLHVVLKSSPHGGGGTVQLTRRSAGADRWTPPETVHTPVLASGPVQLALDAEGRELLMYDYIADNGYAVPGDTDLVGGTASRLVGQRQVGGPLRTIWDRSGASYAKVSTAGGTVRVTWIQWVGHLPHGHHRTTKLRTQLLGKHGATLARTAVGSYWADAVGGAPGAVTWLSPQRHTRQLLAVRVGGHASSGDPVVLDDYTQEPAWWRSDPALAQVFLVGGQPWVAWEHGEVLDSDRSELLDSRVSLAPLTGPG
jgi:hypothetical protein